MPGSRLSGHLQLAEGKEDRPEPRFLGRWVRRGSGGSCTNTEGVPGEGENEVPVQNVSGICLC